MREQVVSQSKATRQQGEFTGWHMLAVMLLFFGVIVTVNITMAVMAGRTWTGLVVKNSYVESQKFNGHLQAARAQHAKGWRTNLSYRDGQLLFQIQDRDGTSVSLTNVQLEYGRPAFEQADRTATLQAIGQGRYSTPLNLGKGDWMLRVTATKDGEAYRRDSRLNVLSAGREGREERG